MTREYFEQTLFKVRDVKFPFANECKLKLVNLNLLLWNLSQHIFVLNFWFSIKDGLGIFKQLIYWSSWKKRHLQSHSSWCVSVNWQFRKGAINSSRSWQIGIVVITLKFASIRERCLTHYPWNLVSSLSWNYCRTVNCLKWMKELICPLFILDSMLPGCIQGTP